MNIQKLAGWITSVTVVGTALVWAWNMHNQFLMSLLSPILRQSYASQINTYRKKMCMDDYSNQVDFDIAMQAYEDLVGRQISARSCDSL